MYYDDKIRNKILHYYPGYFRENPFDWYII